MMLRISIAVIACLPFLASAQWTNAPGTTNSAGSWTNTPGGGVVTPGPNVEPDTVKPGPATESWRRHVGQTGDAHGGIVMTPTNAALTGWALRYSATGRPYYAPIQAADLVTGYTTNLVWMGEIESTGYWNDANAAATNAGSRLPTKDELVAKVMTDPAWINDLYWSGTETTPGNAYLVVAHDFDEYTKGQAIDTSKEAGYWAQAVRTVITTNTALDTFNAHTEQTTAAHGGIMRSASNPGANGQVLLLNGTTGRPYWGDPETGSVAQSLLTSGVARVNGRYVTTNYTVTVSNGTWNGSSAILSATGSVTISANVPLSQWGYDHTAANGIGLVDLVDAGSWVTNSHGLITRGDIYTVKIQAEVVSGVPSPGGGFDTSITVSNLSASTWGAAALFGATNDFQGTIAKFDDPLTELNPVNLRTMQAAIVAINTAPGTWASYDANGAPNRINGVNMGGRRVYLDNQWSLIGNGRYCALSYNGKDIFYISMSNQLLSVANINGGSLVTINVRTNGVTSRPWIEWTSDLVAGNWMEITNATSTYPVKTNGSYLMTFSNVWTAAYFRAVQASSNVSALVATVPIDARGGLALGGVFKTNWPTAIPGAQGPAGTQTIVYVGAEIGPQGIQGVAGRDGRDGLPGQDGVIGRDGLPGITPTISIGAVTTGTTAAVTNSGTSTNVVLDIVIPPGPQGPAGPGMTNMPAYWNGDQVGTNTLYIGVGGRTMMKIDSNGTTMVHGSLQMYEEDLNCNVRLYDGTRLAPSLTFLGHTNEWGLYARGYNGNYVAGWSVAGTEVGLLHQSGITLMSTNFAFYGRLVGDISGATGYPEPIFMNWYTNQWIFNALSISNLTMLNGPITVKDNLNTTRGTLDSTGLTVKDAGAVTRTTIGAQTISLKNSSGLTTTTLDTSLKLKDPTSGNTLLDLGGTYGDYIIQRWPTGQTIWQIGYLYGLQFYDQIGYFERTRIHYNGIYMIDSYSNFVFSIDSQYSKIAVALGMSITNSGDLNFYGVNGTNLCTITGSTGAIKIRGVDSDLRYVTNVRTNMTGFQLTNLWAGVTNILWYNSQGIVTNKTP